MEIRSIPQERRCCWKNWNKFYIQSMERSRGFWFLCFLILLFSCAALFFVFKTLSNSFNVASRSSNNSSPKYQLSYTHPQLQKAQSYFSKYVNDSALTEFKRTLTFFQKENNWEGYVTCSYKIGACFIRLGEYDSASFYLSKANESAITHLSAYHICTVLTHFYWGDYYFRKGIPQSALNEFLKCRSLLMDHHGKDHPTLTYVLDMIGEVYLVYFENPIEAEKYYKEALSLREKSTNTSTPEVANNYYSLSKACQMKGDYEKALSYNNKALHLFSQFEGNFLTHLANSYNLMGNVYFSMGEFASAIPYYNSAISYARRELNKPDGLLINEYNNLGAAYLELNDVRKACKTINYSLKINKSNEDSLELIKSLYNLGIVYYKQNKVDSANYYLKKGLHIGLRYYPAKHPQIANFYHKMGLVQSKNHRLDSALIYFQKSLSFLLPSFDKDKEIYALPDSEDIIPSFQLITLLYDKGKTLETWFKDNPVNVTALKTALECYSVGDAVLRKNRQAFEREGDKLFILKTYRGMYDHALNCTYLLAKMVPEQHYEQRAYDFMERSKSILLLESLQKFEAFNNAVLPDSLIQEEKDLQFKIAEVEFLLKQKKSFEKTDEEHKKMVLVWDSVKLACESRLEYSKMKLQELAPYYVQAKFNSKWTSLADVQNKLETNSQIIEYYWGDSAIFILGITKSEVNFQRVCKVDELRNELHQFMELLSQPSGAHKEKERRDAFDTYSKVSFTLYQNLFKPVAIKKQEGKSVNILIVPDGPLCSVPFEAWVTSKPSCAEVDYKRMPYVLHDFQISYTPSCQILYKKEKSNSWSSSNSILFLSYAPIHKNERVNNEEKEGLFLPHAGQLQQLANEYDGTYCLATKDNLRTHSSKHDIIHLYVHAVADKENPVNSKLLLKKEGQNGQENLFVHELLGMDFKDKWVVLNACETGLGKHYKGEGLYSMARGFTNAGSSGVVMSLWKIDEGPTFELTKLFYRQLINHPDPKQAVYLAKVDYLKNHDHLTSHPSYWAGLITLENSVSYAENPPLYISICVAIFLLTLIWLGIRAYQYKSLGSSSALFRKQK